MRQLIIWRRGEAHISICLRQSGWMLDKIIDGTLSKEETTQQIIEEVNRRIKDESDSNR
ncbi:hypothetical protein MKX67_03635 [Cytobacillus sp. FSL W7-1323]|uniref:hypothetical protein n=1 Tax=Cytobacillus sp. FSL W7-1323 TaxID=2921700 RepID=UPI00315868E7